MNAVLEKKRGQADSLECTGDLSYQHSVVFQNDLVSLTEATGGSSNCLETYYNQLMKPEKLIQVGAQGVSRGRQCFYGEINPLKIAHALLPPLENKIIR